MTKSNRTTRTPTFNSKISKKPTVKLEGPKESCIKPDLLLTLPTEIRLKIYNYAFTHSLVHIAARNRLTFPSNPHPKLLRLIFEPTTIAIPNAHHHKQYIHYITSHDIGILSTCRLFRKKALPICYSTATFQVKGDPEVGLEWLGSLTAKEKESLRELRLKIHDDVGVCAQKQPSLYDVVQREKSAVRTFQSDWRFQGVKAEILKVGVGKF
jgi:hypothetical protein